MTREAAGGHHRSPHLVVEAGRLLTVTPVDEQQGQRGGPVPANRRCVTDQGDHHVIETSPVDGPPEVGQGVEQAELGVDEIGLVPLPAHLVLLRAPVVVEAIQHRGRPAGHRAQIAGRLAAVAADLEEGPERGIGRRRGGGQGQTLLGRHEAPGRLGHGQLDRGQRASPPPADGALVSWPDGHPTGTG